MLSVPIEENQHKYEPLDLGKENLACHHLLFIQDVTTSIYNSEKGDFRSDSIKLYFQRVKLNGIIVVQKRLLSNNNEQELNIWIDDGTSVIKVILPNQMLKRQDSESLVVSNNVTVFGKVQYISNEHVLLCGGFRVEDSDITEMYHWLRVIQERPQEKKSSNKPDQPMFYTLSSYPSPRRLLNDSFLKESPIRSDELINSQNAGFLWSPDHTFATSTPIRAVTVLQESQSSSHNGKSPLRQRSDRVIIPPPITPAIIAQQQKEADEFDDDGDGLFDDFGSGDLLALENNALLMNRDNTPQKRKLQDLMD